MIDQVPTSSSLELCLRSHSVLATRNSIVPSAPPPALREHPLWGHLVSEGSAYERDCKVADAHRALCALPAGLLVKQQEDPSRASSPVKSLPFGRKAALNCFKYGGVAAHAHTNMAVVVSRPRSFSMPWVIAPAPAQRKLARKKGFADLRQSQAV